MVARPGDCLQHWFVDCKYPDCECLKERNEQMDPIEKLAFNVVLTCILRHADTFEEAKIGIQHLNDDFTRLAEAHFKILDTVTIGKKQ